ncbi:hypothetical protein CROQUDRAFT_651752 [Cronartium quercuum f. sp. fusiforme G11]|uniref:Uncharacterized protein n=1 Tax=Cronartium quercuum f. sp. fusiforme G11 TaxID=708437 RepID=A0A9P6TGN1_9BASI|nr:hypothetical protein CROQUDRAFT_651752 [Cronartium quercuum f. sp. fusiforme G11]
MNAATNTSNSMHELLRPRDTSTSLWGRPENLLTEFDELFQSFFPGSMEEKTPLGSGDPEGFRHSIESDELGSNDKHAVPHIDSVMMCYPGEDPMACILHATNCATYGTFENNPLMLRTFSVGANMTYLIPATYRQSQSRSGRRVFYKRAPNIRELDAWFKAVAAAKLLWAREEGRMADTEGFFKRCTEPHKRVVEVKLTLGPMRKRRNRRGKALDTGKQRGPSPLGPGRLIQLGPFSYPNQAYSYVAKHNMPPPLSAP